MRALLAAPLTEADVAARLAGHEPDPGEVTIMLLSGGTTSLSKLIPRTHEDYVLNARLCGRSGGFDEATVFMAILPLGHTYNLASPGMLGCFYYGGTVVLAPSGDAGDVFSLVQREKVSVIAAVVPLISNWLNSPVPDDYDLSTLKVIQGKNLRRSTVHDLDIRASGSWIGAFLRGTRLSWRGAEGSGRGRAAPSQQLTIKLAGQSREETVWLEHVEHVSLGWQDETYYDDPKPPLASYRVGTTYEGKVTGVTDFGVFVDFDGHRDGLVHMRRLEQRGRRLSSFQPGQRLVVKLVGTRVRDNGKEEVELDLAEE